MKYLCVSGGADSTAMALLLWERGEDFEMLFSDTGIELPESLWLLPRLAARVGKKLNVVSGGGFFSLFVNWGFYMPGFQARWCTKSLKIIPQDYFAKANNITEMGVGIRADEPRRIRTERMSYAHFDTYYPLAEAGYGKSEVKELCRKHDLLNPVYEWRTNVSCFCCFFQRKSDWKGLLKNHPSLYELSAEWERQASKTSHSKHTWNDRFSLDDLREATEQQIEIWPDCDEQPCLICVT